MYNAVLCQAFLQCTQDIFVYSDIRMVYSKICIDLENRYRLNMLLYITSVHCNIVSDLLLATYETVYSAYLQAMFTLYRIVKWRVAESVPDRASVHTRNAAFDAVSAPEQYCSAPMLKVERSVSDRFLKRSESSLNTFILGAFIGAEITTEPRFGKLSFQIKRERCKLHNG